MPYPLLPLYTKTKTETETNTKTKRLKIKPRSFTASNFNNGGKDENN